MTDTKPDTVDTSAAYVTRVCKAAPFADNIAGIPQMVELIRALAAERDKWRDLDAQAAEHVESVIAMRTGFTGNPPYVGWKGLGLALTEALDERDALVSERNALYQQAAKYTYIGKDGKAVLAKDLEAERDELRGVCKEMSGLKTAMMAGLVHKDAIDRNVWEIADRMEQILSLKTNGGNEDG